MMITSRFMRGALVCAWMLMSYLSKAQSNLDSTYPDTTVYSDTVILLFDINLDTIVFIPEVEDMLEDLEFYDEGKIKKFKIKNIMRLMEGDETRQLIADIQQYYRSESVKLSDPNRNKIFNYFKKDVENATSLIEVRFKIINDILFFEFIRYDVKEDGPEYISSATSYISLIGIEDTKIKERFRYAIHKIFPKTNQSPQVTLIANGNYIDDEYYYAVGDSIFIQAKVEDYDSPEEDISYLWNSESLHANLYVPLKSYIPNQKFTVDSRGSFDVGVKINDRINTSTKTVKRFNVIQKPSIETSWFTETNSNRIKSYFWDFSGEPRYYESNELDVNFDINVDENTKYHDNDQLELNIHTENIESIVNLGRALAVKKDDSLLNRNISYNFILAYDSPLARMGTSSSGTNIQRVKGQLFLPEAIIPSGEYIIGSTLSHYGIESFDDQHLLVDMRKINRFSIAFDYRNSFILLQDSVRSMGDQIESTYFNKLLSAGMNYKITSRVSGMLMPGIFIIPEDVWQLNVRFGLEYDFFPLDKKITDSDAFSRDRQYKSDIGIELNGNFTKGIYNGEQLITNFIYFTGSVYYKRYLSNKPSNVLKIGLYFDYLDRTELSDNIGIMVGWMFHTFERRKNTFVRPIE